MELGLADERSQWYLPDAAAMDGVFDVNETYRDSQLAYDLRGTLGVRPCPPYTGASCFYQCFTRAWACRRRRDERRDVSLRMLSLGSRAHRGHFKGFVRGACLEARVRVSALELCND